MIVLSFFCHYRLFNWRRLPCPLLIFLLVLFYLLPISASPFYFSFSFYPPLLLDLFCLIWSLTLANANYDLYRMRVGATFNMRDSTFLCVFLKWEKTKLLFWVKSGYYTCQFKMCSPQNVRENKKRVCVREKERARERCNLFVPFLQVVKGQTYILGGERTNFTIV